MKSYGKNINKIMESELREALQDLPVGDIYCFDCIGSTNDFGFECSAADAPDMTIITAAEQNKGRGRMQRSWVTVPGASLPLTVIIRPNAYETDHINLFSPLTGLAVLEGLRTEYGIKAQIKWPNDVLLNRRKISGVLCETQWEGDKLNALILGVGINLLHGSVPDIPMLNYPASSVEDETGIIISRIPWIHTFISQIIRLRPLIGKKEFFDLWENNLAYKGEEAMLVKPDGNSEQCTVCGIAADGSLITADKTGKKQEWLAGEISLRTLAGNS